MKYSVNGVKVIDKYRDEKGINGFDRSIFPKMEFKKRADTPLIIFVLLFDFIFISNVAVNAAFSDNMIIGIKETVPIVLFIQAFLVVFVAAVKSPQSVPEEYYTLKEKRSIALWMNDIQTMNITPWYFNDNEKKFVEAYCSYIAYASKDVPSCGLSRERRNELEAFLYYKWENMNSSQRKNVQKNGIKFRFYSLDNRQYNALMSINSKSKVIKKDYKESNIALKMMYDLETKNHIEHKHFI